MDVIIIVVTFMMSGFAEMIPTMCHKNESFNSGGINTYRLNYYCCAHHENRTGICTECSIGYTSREGEMCATCTNNTYGERCKGLCSCAMKQRCDNVVGCISVTESTTHDSTGTYKVAIFSSIQPKLHTMEIDRKTNTDKPDTTGNVSVIIYLLCTGVLSVFIVIGIVCLQHRRKNIRKIRVSRDENPVAPGITDIGRDESVTGRTESVYDIIDDLYFAENS